jgi:hypothetical protein
VVRLKVEASNTARPQIVEFLRPINAMLGANINSEPPFNASSTKYATNRFGTLRGGLRDLSAVYEDFREELNA